MVHNLGLIGDGCILAVYARSWLQIMTCTLISQPALGQSAYTVPDTTVVTVYKSDIAASANLIQKISLAVAGQTRDSVRPVHVVHVIDTL